MNVPIIFILSIILIIFLFGKRDSMEQFRGENALFTMHPTSFMCSKDMDKSPLNIRVTDAGGIMYVSNETPISTIKNKKCKIIPCPHKAKVLNSMYTVPEISHYKPLPVYDRTVCWNCT